MFSVSHEKHFANGVFLRVVLSILGSFEFCGLLCQNELWLAVVIDRMIRYTYSV
jgi:hypothetical protein